MNKKHDSHLMPGISYKALASRNEIINMRIERLSKNTIVDQTPTIEVLKKKKMLAHRIRRRRTMLWP